MHREDKTPKSRMPRMNSTSSYLAAASLSTVESVSHLDPATSSLCPPECLEAERLVLGRDARPLVAHAHPHVSVIVIHGHEGDRRTGGRVFGSIAHQVHQNLSNAQVVGLHRGQVAWDGDGETMCCG